jgi:two-component system cell cycle response regulator CpdR
MHPQRKCGQDRIRDNSAALNRRFIFDFQVALLFVHENMISAKPRCVKAGHAKQRERFLNRPALWGGMSTHNSLRILLAEDEEAMRGYLARALENAGYEVVAVDRGTAALPYLENEHFDLLLSDIVMPEMDGIELAQRCNEVSPRTKVMFITGFAAVTLRASREQPQAKVLSKPFHLRDLVVEVERIFDDQAQASR